MDKADSSLVSIGADSALGEKQMRVKSRAGGKVNTKSKVRESDQRDHSAAGDHLSESSSSSSTLKKKGKSKKKCKKELEMFLESEMDFIEESISQVSIASKSKSKKKNSDLSEFLEQEHFDFPELCNPVGKNEKHATKQDPIGLHVDSELTTDVSVEKTSVKSIQSSSSETVVKSKRDSNMTVKPTKFRSKKTSIVLDNTLSESPLNPHIPAALDPKISTDRSKKVLMKTPSSRLSTDCLYNNASKPRAGKMKLLKSDELFNQSPINEVDDTNSSALLENEQDLKGDANHEINKKVSHFEATRAETMNEDVISEVGHKSKAKKTSISNEPNAVSRKVLKENKGQEKIRKVVDNIRKMSLASNSKVLADVSNTGGVVMEYSETNVGIVSKTTYVDKQMESKLGGKQLLATSDVINVSASSPTRSLDKCNSIACQTDNLELDNARISASVKPSKPTMRDASCQVHLCSCENLVGFSTGLQNASLDLCKDLLDENSACGNNDTSFPGSMEQQKTGNVISQAVESLQNVSSTTAVESFVDENVDDNEDDTSEMVEVSACNISLQTSVYPFTILDDSDNMEVEGERENQIVVPNTQPSVLKGNNSAYDKATSSKASTTPLIRDSDSFVDNTKCNFSLGISGMSFDDGQKLVVSESFEEVAAGNVSQETSVFYDDESKESEGSDTHVNESELCADEVSACNISIQTSMINTTQHANATFASPAVKLTEESSRSAEHLKSIPRGDRNDDVTDDVSQECSAENDTNMQQSYEEVTACSVPIQTSMMPFDCTVDETSEPQAVNVSATSPRKLTDMASNETSAKKMDENSAASQVNRNESPTTRTVVDKCESIYYGSPSIMMSRKSSRRSSWLPPHLQPDSNRRDICSSTHRRSQIQRALDDLDDLSPIAVAAHYEGKVHRRLSMAPSRVTMCGIMENDSVEQESNASQDMFFTPPPGVSVKKRRSVAAARVLIADSDGEETDRRHERTGSSNRTAHGKTVYFDVTDSPMATEKQPKMKYHDSSDSSDCDDINNEVRDSRRVSYDDKIDGERKEEKKTKVKRNVENEREGSDESRAVEGGVSSQVKHSDESDDDGAFEKFLKESKKTSVEEFVDDEADEDLSAFIVSDDAVSISDDDDDDDDVVDDNLSNDNDDESDDNAGDDKDDDAGDDKGEDDDDVESSDSSRSDELPDISVEEKKNKEQERHSLIISSSDYDSEDDFKKPNPPRSVSKKTSDKPSQRSATGVSSEVELTKRLKDLEISNRRDAAYYEIPPRVPEKLKRTPVGGISPLVKKLPDLPPSALFKHKEFEMCDDDIRKTRSVDDDEFRTPVSQRPANKLTVMPHSTGHSLIRHSFLQSLSTKVKPHERDPAAHRFVEMFQTLRQDLTEKLFILFNETVFENKIPSNTPVIWNDRMTKSAGYCSYKRRNVTERSVTINLSVKVVDNAERLRDTLIHEMCHAAVWIIHGVNESHGKFWKHWAYKANKEYRELPPILRCHGYKINTKYIYRCTKCGYEIGRHSKSLDTARKVCGYCTGTFELLLRSKSPTATPYRPGAALTLASGTPYKPRSPNAFAKFVKENYPLVMAATPGSGMKDTMRIVSKMYSDKKAAAAASKNK